MKTNNFIAVKRGFTHKNKRHRCKTIALRSKFKKKKNENVRWGDNKVNIMLLHYVRGVCIKHVYLCNLIKIKKYLSKTYGKRHCFRNVNKTK